MNCLDNGAKCNMCGTITMNIVRSQKIHHKYAKTKPSLYHSTHYKFQFEEITITIDIKSPNSVGGRQQVAREQLITLSQLSAAVSRCDRLTAAEPRRHPLRFMGLSGPEGGGSQWAHWGIKRWGGCPQA